MAKEVKTVKVQENQTAKAIVKNAKVAPRKARLVIDLIRGEQVKKAKAILMFTNRKASPIILKALNSAIANAVNNYKLDAEKLFVKECYVSEGLKMKRILPRAKGSGDVIRKRLSHIYITLAERQ